MIRRRRRVREIPFSFDSFLDVVANVVGIIIRLILVVWIGARSYSSVQLLTKSDRPQEAIPSENGKDPLENELARQRQELAQARERLLEQLRQLGETRAGRQPLEQQLGAVTARGQELDKESAGLERSAAKDGRQGGAPTLQELHERRTKLDDELRRLEMAPPVKKVLRYRTPVSRPVQGDEIFFECSQGRVAFIDVASLVAKMRREAEEKVPLLRYQWQVRAFTPSVGAFRLQFEIERERELFEALASTTPDPDAHFRPVLGSWIVEPVTPLRGESLTEALSAGSQFRQVADFLDPRSVTVTFWIYPDSFSLFRQLRDYLYDRNVVVAGRPLPDGYPITCSRKGSPSRGQ